MGPPGGRGGVRGGGGGAGPPRAVALALERMGERDVVFVGHGHFSRAVLARWMELPVSEGIRMSMTPASVAVCGFEHGLRQIVALGLTGRVGRR